LSGGEVVPAKPGARGYKWADAEPGNLLALRHGAYSPRFVDPLAAELATVAERQAAEDGSPVAFLRDVTHRPALLAWARAEAQCQLLSEYLARKGDEAGDGVGDLADPRVHAAYALLHRAEARAERMRSRLGLDPLSRARLSRDLTAATVDVARLMAALDDGSDDADDDG
jgi:hypothetical protein